MSASKPQAEVLAQAVAQLAGLPISDADVALLANGFAAVLADQTLLRASIPPELAPLVVFDPRWD